MTPFDWLTSGIVTLAESPFASTIITIDLDANSYVARPLALQISLSDRFLSDLIVAAHRKTGSLCSYLLTK